MSGEHEIPDPAEVGRGLFDQGRIMAQSEPVPILSATLPIELTNGNDGRGSKWFSSAKLRKHYEATVGQFQYGRSPFRFIVRLEVTRILGKGQRLWDADSILRGSAKELIDSLVALGWFVDDSPKWIGAVVGYQDATQREIGPAVQVEVFKMP